MSSPSQSHSQSKIWPQILDGSAKQTPEILGSRALAPWLEMSTPPSPSHVSVTPSASTAAASTLVDGAPLETSPAVAKHWRDVVDQLQEITQVEPGDSEVHDATILAAARWAKVRCGEIQRYEALLGHLDDEELASHCSSAELEPFDESEYKAKLLAQFNDASQPLSIRIWAAIEIGLGYAEKSQRYDEALKWYQSALQLDADHPLALELATQAACLSASHGPAREHREHQLQVLDQRLENPDNQGWSQYFAPLNGSLCHEHHDFASGPLAKAIQDNDDEAIRTTLLAAPFHYLATTAEHNQCEQLCRIALEFSLSERASLAQRVFGLSIALHHRPQPSQVEPRLAQAIFDLFENQEELQVGSAEETGLFELGFHLVDVLVGQEDFLHGDYVEPLERLLERLCAISDHPLERNDLRFAQLELRVQRLRTLAPIQSEGIDSPSRILAQKIIDQLEHDPIFGSMSGLSQKEQFRWARAIREEILAELGDFPALALALDGRALASEDPEEQAFLWNRAGRVYQNLIGAPLAARNCFSQASSAMPSDTRSLLPLSQQHELLGHYEASVQNLQDFVAHSQTVEESLLGLRRLSVVAHRYLGDADLALSSLRDIHQQAPEDFSSWMQSAMIARHHDRASLLVDALSHLHKLVEDPATRSSIAFELAYVLDQRLSRHEDAQNWYRVGLEDCSSYAPCRRELARNLWTRGDNDGVLEIYLRNTHPDLDSSTTLEALRYALALPSEDPRRVQLSTHAAQHFPKIKAIGALAAQSQFDAGNASTAYTLLSVLPENTEPMLAAQRHFELASMAHSASFQDKKRGKMWRERAQQHFRQCLFLQPDHREAFQALYRDYSEQGDHASMDALLATVDEQVDRVTRIQHLCVRARLAAQDPDKLSLARTLYEQALLLRPGDLILRSELDAVLRQLSTPRSIFNNLVRQAAEITSPKIRATLAIEAAETLLEHGAKPDMATIGRLILSALKSDPGNPHAAAMLELFLSWEPQSLPLRTAVSARAARAQSEEEKAIFFAESGELLESVESWDDSLNAFHAAAQVLRGTGLIEESIARVTRSRNEAPSSPQPEGNYDRDELQQIKDKVAYSLQHRNESTAQQALAQLEKRLQHQADDQDAIELVISLGNSAIARLPAVTLLISIFDRLKHPRNRYLCGVWIGNCLESASDALPYLNCAQKADPEGLEVLEALRDRYRELNEVNAQIECLKRILQHPQLAPTRRNALRRELVRTLVGHERYTSVGLELCTVLLRETPQDIELLDLYSRLLAQDAQPLEAAHVLNLLLANLEITDDKQVIYLRQAELYAQTPQSVDRSWAALHKALHLGCNAPQSVDLALELHDHYRQHSELRELHNFLYRGLLQRLSEGRGDRHDLSRLSGLFEKSNHHRAAAMATLSSQLSATKDSTASSGSASQPRLPSFSQLSPRVIERSRSLEEAPALQSVLTLAERYFDDLGELMGEAAPERVLPFPSNAPVAALEPTIEHIAEQLGIERPLMLASDGDQSCMLRLDPSAELRFGRRFWAQADIDTLRGLSYLCAARYLWKAPRVRALPATELDLLVAAAFELSGHFNAIVAEPEPHRLTRLKEEWQARIHPSDAHLLQGQCKSLARFEFSRGLVARACMQSDLQLAVEISQDLPAVMKAAAALDNPKALPLPEQIANSPHACRLLAAILYREQAPQNSLDEAS